MKNEAVTCFHGGPFGSCDVYVLHSEKGTILVDPGFCSEEMLAHLHLCGGLDAILVTHSHYDQIGGLEALLREFPGAAVYHHVLDEGFSGDAERNGSRRQGRERVIHTSMQALAGGLHLIGGYTVLAIHTPGHTMGSCTYVLPEEHAVFLGDTLDPWAETDISWPTGCGVCLAESVEKLRTILQRMEGQVYTSHGGSCSAAALLRRNPHLNRELRSYACM